MTPNGPHRHSQCPADFVWIHVFTIAKNQNRARFVRQRSNQLSETFLQQRIRFRCGDGNFRQFLHLDFLPKARAPQCIDAAMDCRSAEPCDTVGTCFDGSPILKQFEEDLLGHFFRDRRVVEEVKGDAVDHTLMFVNDGLKVGVRHLPSQLITIEGAITTQNLFCCKLEDQMKSLLCLIAIVGLLASCAPAPSSKDQSSSTDPLSGTWVGEWGPSPDRQSSVTVELKWDGTALKGTVNPGRNAIELSKATFDPQSQAVSMELDAPGANRNIVHYVVNGKVSGTTMSGTFDRGGETGTFKIEKR